eukprot:Seg6486.3 transcript_id=Seg6486.3/GoldUCD/mRNA.D3Y31 product="putative protein KIAA0513" protein_id=Seg6486.3/GoldUCD/D3Y31
MTAVLGSKFNASNDIKKGFCIDYNGETMLFEEECENFMNSFVKEIFSESSNITQESKSKFGLLCQHSQARIWFSRLIDAKRVDCKEVDEIVFFRLVQYFAIVLFECYLSDDFAPATTLLNMAFTFYHVTGFNEAVHDSPKRSDSPLKQFIYSYLKDQEIWKSIRFWTSSFLFAVDVERRKRPKRGSWRSLNEEEQQEVNSDEENSAFGHLGTFLYMMKSINIAKETREVFISKISTIENLSHEQIQELIESVAHAD